MEADGYAVRLGYKDTLGKEKIYSSHFYPAKQLYVTKRLELIKIMKIAPNRRCGHLSDREDRDFCDGESKEHVNITF